jgi:glutamate-1-semialdehyde 2,1-aminomutase
MSVIATPGSSRLAGGASSPVRAGAAVGGDPFLQASGRGAYAYDADGRAYVDYLMAYGPLLFGHAHPALVTGLDDLAAAGTVFGSTHHGEVHLAERLGALVPSLERLRFVSTGTEAMMSAIRVARAYTRRPLVLRFAGNYHGHFDAALHDAGASSLTAGDAAAAGGIPEGVRADVIVARYNDLGDVDRRLAGRETSLAAIAVEPAVGNMGLVAAEPGFLEGLFERARRCGALVIFDEVITWPRFGLGGAQGALGLRPDVTALGKVLGGGFPLAAFGGRADVMAALAPEGAAFTGGTFSGNPFCVALGHRLVDLLLRDPDVICRIDGRAAELAAGMRMSLAARGLPYSVSQLGGMVDLKFLPHPPRDYGDATRADKALFARYYHAMRERGILLAPSSNELMFLSSEHGPAEVHATLRAFEGALDVIA